MSLLKSAGHDVRTVSEDGLAGSDDKTLLLHACVSGRIVLTRNAVHFRRLHLSNPEHPGIMVVYNDRDPKKNMSLRDLVKAIENIEASGLVLNGEFIILNSWNY